jgi:hypothetical protein
VTDKKCYLLLAVLRVLVYVVILRRGVIWPEQLPVSFLVQISDCHFVETGLNRLGSPVVQVNAVDTTAGFELFAEGPGVVVEGAAPRKACIGIIQVLTKTSDIRDARSKDCW